MDNKITLSGVLSWLICTLFFMYEFVLRTLLGTFQPQVMQDLHLSSMQFALLSTTVFQLIYGLMQIPIGMLTDSLGLKKTLLSAALICAIANLGFSLTHNFIIAILFRMLMGLGASCGFICLLITIYDWMPRKNIGFFIGISQFIGTIGPMFAAGPLNSILLQAGISWRNIFSSCALIGALISILVFFFVKNNRQIADKLIILQPTSSFLSKLLILIKQKQIWFISIYSACIYFSLEYLTENEGVTFLIAKGFSAKFSSYMITLAWLGYAVACPLLGYFSDKIQRRTPFMAASALILLFSLIGIIYLPIQAMLISICFILLGVGVSGSSLGFVIMAEQCRENSLATGLGFNNTMLVISTSLIAPVIGALLSQESVSTTLSLLIYQKVFIILVLLALGATLISLFNIKETFCKSTCSNTILNLKAMNS